MRRLLRHLGSLLLCSMLLGSPRGADANPASSRHAWGLSVEGGSYIALQSTFEPRPRALVGLRATYRVWRYLELGLHTRFSGDDTVSQLDLAADLALRFDWRRWRFVAGLGVGAAAIHVGFDVGSLWTGALMLQPELGVGFAPWPWLEVRAYLAKVSLYFNEFWMSAWEPSLVLSYRL
jgi:hypothetical protein